jgi:CheY-like chemotaxis protein
VLHDQYSILLPRLHGVWYALSPFRWNNALFRVRPTKVASPKQHTVLVCSRHRELADVRKNVLEEAGFKVITSMDLNSIREACKQDKIDLVMIGYSLPPGEKRRVWHETHKSCYDIPILELYENGKPELMPRIALFTEEARTPVDFLEAVRRILTPESAA